VAGRLGGLARRLGGVAGRLGGLARRLGGVAGRAGMVVRVVVRVIVGGARDGRAGEVRGQPQQGRADAGVVAAGGSLDAVTDRDRQAVGADPGGA
jgi:hypothetical protein